MLAGSTRPDVTEKIREKVGADPTGFDGQIWLRMGNYNHGVVRVQMGDRGGLKCINHWNIDSLTAAGEYSGFLGFCFPKEDPPP